MEIWHLPPYVPSAEELKAPKVLLDSAVTRDDERERRKAGKEREKRKSEKRERKTKEGEKDERVRERRKKERDERGREPK